MLHAIIWGGTQITTTRIILAVIAEIGIIAYLLFALRLFGR
jgi:hypothetical protein